MITHKGKQTPHDYRIQLIDEDLQLLDFKNTGKILEICCGDGKNTVWFKEKGFEVFGVESNRTYYEEAKEKVGDVILNHDVFTQKLPYKSNSFDVIYSYQYLNHNYKEKVEAVFREIHRVLKPGGIFMLKFTDMAQFNVKQISVDIFQELDLEFGEQNYKLLAPQTFAKMSGDEKDIPHYAYYFDELENSLKKTGFEIINARTIKWNHVFNVRKKAD